MAAATEVAGTGVTVNGVYPGIMDTAMRAQLREAPVEIIGEEQRTLLRERFARGELHDPLDIGRLIAAVVLGKMQGEIVNMDDERGRELLRSLPA